MIRNLIAILVVFISVHLSAQPVPIELQVINPVSELSSDITQERSMVIISTLDKDETWKEHAAYVHKSFRLMGIDAVFYTHYLDYTANADIKGRFGGFADNRKVSFMFLLYQGKEGFELAIIDRNQPLVEQSSWYSSRPLLSEIMVDLAVSLKRTEHINQNFLISQEPEYISYLPLYKGTSRLSYPDRLKRLRLAVMLIPEINIPDSIENTQMIAKINQYNEEVRSKNDLIKATFSDYPYKVELIEQQAESEIYKKGFQYVMNYVHTSVGSARKLLGYEEEHEEYVSQWTDQKGRKNLKTIGKEVPVYKWYIKQVVVSDVHTGRYWDASPDFSTSLESFITYFRQSLDK